MFTYGPDIMADKFSGELAAIVEAIVSFDAFSARGWGTSPPATSATASRSGTTGWWARP